MKDSIENKLEIYLKGARAFFEDIRVSSRFSTFSGDDYARNADVVFNNKVIDYKIDNEQKLEIIHYTNLVPMKKNKGKMQSAIYSNIIDYYHTNHFTKRYWEKK